MLFRYVCDVSLVFENFVVLFGLYIVQLLNELKIQSVGEDGNALTLMSIVKNPIVQYFPVDVRRFGTSKEAALINLDDFVATLDLERPVVFAIGAISKGFIAPEFVETSISFSHYALSASVACSKLCCAFEKAWDVL